MAELRQNGSVNVTENGTTYLIDKKDGMKASVITKSGDTCTMQAQGQSVTVRETAHIVTRDNDASMMVTTDSDRTSRNTARIKGKVGSIGDSFGDKLTPYNPFTQLLQATLDTTEFNTSKSIGVVSKTLKASGITCTDKEGKASTPVLSVPDVRNLAEGIVGKPR